MSNERARPPAEPDPLTQVDDPQVSNGAPLPDLGPKFEVLGRIGQGSMGSVYRVRHRDLDHVRAIKVILGNNTEIELQRLRQEATIATGLAYPNIVTVYDLDQLPGGGLGARAGTARPPTGTTGHAAIGVRRSARSR